MEDICENDFWEAMANKHGYGEEKSKVFKGQIEREEYFPYAPKRIFMTSAEQERAEKRRQGLIHAVKFKKVEYVEPVEAFCFRNCVFQLEDLFLIGMQPLQFEDLKEKN